MLRSNRFREIPSEVEVLRSQCHLQSSLDSFQNMLANLSRHRLNAHLSVQVLYREQLRRIL